MFMALIWLVSCCVGGGAGEAMLLYGCCTGCPYAAEAAGGAGYLRESRTLFKYDNTEVE